MSLHRKLLVIIATLCAITLCSQAKAQQVGFFGSGDDDSDFTSLYDPFCDLDTCWFEPIHCDCPDERPLNSGWFFGYQRMYVSVSRPRNQPTSIVWDPQEHTGAPDVGPITSILRGTTESGDYLSDRAWGNRFDFGWMSEQGTGLWFVARKLDSPSTTVEYDNIDLNVDNTNRLDEEAAGPTFATLNGLQMWGFEGNRVWRLQPKANGTVVEPFVGARYARLRDLADRTDFFTDAPDQAASNPLTSGANSVLVKRLSANYRDAEITTDNDLFGGQLGMRTRWRRGRWQVASDLRAIMFFNHWNRETRVDNEVQQEVFQATYDAAGNFASFTEVANTLTQTHVQENNFESGNTFVYGGELHIDASFELTQGFALTLGGEVIWFGDGVGRGYAGSDDSLVLAGMTAGFTFNR